MRQTNGADGDRRRIEGGEKEKESEGQKERKRERAREGKNLRRLVFHAIYREKPEKGLRVRDWRELSDAEVEAEVDRRFGTRQSRKRKSFGESLLSGQC